MRRLWPLFLFITIFVIALAAKLFFPTKNNPREELPQRIISLAPSVTETLFALGAGEHIVGVTNFCDYPQQAKALPKVGGYINPSLETIAALEPDLVILLASQQQTIEQLNQLQIATLPIHNRTLPDIKRSISLIADQLGHSSQAQQLISKIDHTTQTIEQKVAGLNRPKVMISMGHSGSNINFKQFYIAGQQDFYNDLITLAGGQNSYQHPTPAVPSVSIEGLLQLNPDIIIDIFPDADDHQASLDEVKQHWAQLSHLKAVKNKQVHIIEQDYATIPGPRIFLLLQQIAALIHPQLDWQDLDVKN